MTLTLVGLAETEVTEARGTHRTLKVARTIADLVGAICTSLEHVAEALQYRPAL